jgi:hypothetical protein
MNVVGPLASSATPATMAAKVHSRATAAYRGSRKVIAKT